MEPFIDIYNKENKTYPVEFKKPATNEDRKFYKCNKEYFIEPIKYFHNSYGYRTHNKLPIEYVLVMGCSHTYGTGLHEYERYSNLVEEKIGLPVINLGVPGIGINFMLLNIMKLINSNLVKPKVLICQNPNLYRLSLPRTDKELLNIVPNNKKYQSLYEDNSLLTHSTICYNIIKDTLINNKIKLIDFYIWNSVGDKEITPIDFARDNEHPGPKSNKLFADYILEKI